GHCLSSQEKRAVSASVDGLVSGLDTTSLINQLMTLERAPVTLMQKRQATFGSVGKAWDDLAGRITTLRTAAEAIDTLKEASLYKATSSNTGIVTATAGTSASPGPQTFQVMALAVANQKMSTGFASSAATVGAGTALIAGGLGAIGATGIEASTDFTAGAHTLAVTRSGSELKVSLDGGEGMTVTAGQPV